LKTNVIEDLESRNADDDTSPEIKKLVRSQLLARSGAERMQMGSRMFDAAGFRAYLIKRAQAD